MPARLLRLEERIVLDAAAPDPPGPHAPVPDPVAPTPAQALLHALADLAAPVIAPHHAHEHAAGAGDGQADAVHSPPENPLAAVLSPDTNAGDAPQRILVVSSSLAQAETLAEAAANHVTTLVFNAQELTLAELFRQIHDAADGRPVESIALATHGIAGGGFELVNGAGIDLASLANTELRQFWQQLGELVGPNGRIDLLACDAGRGPEGEALVAALEQISGVNVAASVDGTGNESLGADWLLETDGVAAGALYFDHQRLAGFDEVLALPDVNDSDPSPSATGGAGPVLVDPAINVDDGGAGPLLGAAVRIRNGFVPGEDRLSFDEDLAWSNYGISGEYHADTGELILIGPASGEAFQQVLRTVAYENISDTPHTTPREIFFVIGDDFGAVRYCQETGHYYRAVSGNWGWAGAAAAAEGQSIGGLNGYLATIMSAQENAVVAPLVGLLPAFPVQAGWLGASGTIADGIWEWSVGPEAGTHFWESGPVAGAYANWAAGNPDVAADSFLTIVPGGQWDDSMAGPITGLIAEFGGLPTDTEGVLTASVTVDVVVPNHAPVLDNSGLMSLSSINEDDHGSPGNTVASIISSAGGDRITDYNADPEGIAIIGLDDAHGTWQFSIDGGNTWSDAGSISPASALGVPAVGPTPAWPVATRRSASRRNRPRYTSTASTMRRCSTMRAS
jgi:hypothetical protein